MVDPRTKSLKFCSNFETREEKKGKPGASLTLALMLGHVSTQSEVRLHQQGLDELEPASYQE
jgi:hypothetical protein